MYIKMFEDFSNENPKKKKKKKTKSCEIENFTPPEYAVQPAEGDKGFFMFKKAFDSMKRMYKPGYYSTT